LLLPDPGELDRLCQALELEGLSPRAAMDWGRLQDELKRDGCPDIFVIDPLLETPDKELVGLVLRKNRHTGSALMVLITKDSVLTALPSVMEEVADIVISPSQLVGGIRKALRLLGTPDSSQQWYGSVSESLDELTPVEQRLLKVMCLQYNRPVSRDLLLHEVWGYGQNVMTRTVDTHIKRLRKKLEGAPWQIRTVRGFGYRLGGIGLGDAEA
jgi:two-component system phosphate regulon response regulator PhoB